jgi:hypothetical protein
MTKPPIHIQLPKAYFQAQNFGQRARLYDLEGDSKNALKGYVKAIKIFIALVEQYPELSRRNYCLQEIDLMLNRINLLKAHLEAPPSVASRLTKDAQEEEAIRERFLRCKYTPDPRLTPDSIIGLEPVKKHLNRTIMMPLKDPNIYNKGLKLLRSVMLFGPPGCGKTKLIKVTAGELPVDVFIVSAGTIISKYQGESQKNIRIMYEVAWEHAPSVIFIDEFDAVFGTSRKPGASHTEASYTAQQVQSELQLYMDGPYTPTVNETVTIVATNFPWSFQAAQTRRFQRVLYVPPPGPSAIYQLLKFNLRKVDHSLTENQLRWLSYNLLRYTPDEIENICTSAYNDVEARIGENQAPPVICLRDILNWKELIRPILDLHDVVGVGTQWFRDWNERFGKPRLNYPVEPWEEGKPQDNPVVLEDVD